jgi:hypothetical protein
LFAKIQKRNNLLRGGVVLISIEPVSQRLFQNKNKILHKSTPALLSFLSLFSWASALYSSWKTDSHPKSERAPPKVTGI